jgi:phage-related protein
MKEYTHFYYNGVSSMEMGLINVSVKDGLFEESFLASRSINEVKIRGNSKPYFMSIEREPLEFDLEFAFLNPYDKKHMAEVAMWLDQNYYRELYFTENPDRRFFCIMEGASDLVHNGYGQGYITIHVRCDSAYSYSQEYLSKEIDFTNNVATGTDYSFGNIGHVDLKPEIWIKKFGAGDVSILNKASGQFFEFKGLLDQEIVYIDNEREHIESNIQEVFRYDNFNDEYLYLEKGRNILNVKGNCKLQFRYRFKTIQG